jgi:polysaccharide deacetylase 2 family uncharacterized protein YibQ
MANTKTKRKTGKKARAVRPVFLVMGAVALVGFGLIVGASLDFVTRPEPATIASTPRDGAARPALSRQFRPPQFLNIEPDDLQGEADGGRVPEFLEEGARRAWAPERLPSTSNESSPLVAFAVSSTAPTAKPAIAIVIDDMGLDRARSLRMMELGGPLTISLMTYANGLSDLAARARNAGHEVMGHLPMEPQDSGENPGPGALLTNMDAQTIRQHLAMYLDKWEGYVGINNHMGSKFTSDPARMGVVMEELKVRGLMWLDSKTIVNSAGPAAAAAANVPYVERDVFLDNIDSGPAILEQLAALERTAKSRGFAIGIGHPRDATIEALNQWIPTLRDAGISLVPVTEILKRRQRAQGKLPG